LSAKGRAVLGHPLVLPFYLPSFILSISGGLLAPVLPLFARELDVSYALIGLVLSGEAVGMLLGDVPAGVLMRRLGLKRTMVIGVACMTLATAALFGAANVPAAVALRVLAGFGHALFGVAQHAYVTGVASVGRRGRAIALYGGVTRVGHFLGPMAGGLVAAAYSLRAAFLLFGAVNLITVTAIALFMQPPPARRRDQAGIQGGLLLATLRTYARPLTVAGAGQILAQMIRTSRSAIIPLYAADIIGLDVQAIGLIISLSSAVDMSLFYPAGWIMDNLGRKCAIVPSFAIQALGMLLVPFTASFAGLLAAASLVGLGNGIGSGSMMTLGADLAPSEARGEFLGIWRFIGDSGHMGGPLIVGQVADLVTLPHAAWAMAAAGVGAALVFGLLLPEPLKTRRAQAPSPQVGHVAGGGSCG
jgi:MFS family permease